MPRVREYHLNDPDQETDDWTYWRGRSIEERLDALQAIRRSWGKMNGIDHDRVQGLRGPVRIVERE
ncbi:MAG: hypothetical protein ACI9BV_003254 [Rhodothermales bacterium]|jgi:hypothetical protein